MTASMVAFDDVRELLREEFRAIAQDLPGNAPNIYVVRNMFGKIGMSVSKEFEADNRLRAVLARLTRKLRRRLGTHSCREEDFVLWVRPELLAVLDDAAQELIPKFILADRLVTGAGWWTMERNGGAHPIRYALYSVKGGVGRSTTAAILAWHLARQGEDVLTIDLDLESPGLASALLKPRVKPNFGVTDWFVEELVGQGKLLIDQIVGIPTWSQDLQGTVWVAPAHGHNPGEYLAKLGRVYMDTAADRWTARLRRMIDSLEERLKPTVVILESRSGLHDVAAATITDLSAEVLLFAVDSPANWLGYRILFEHWKELGLASRIRDHLSVVSALTPELDRERYLMRFRENSWDLFRDCLYDNFFATTTAPDSVYYAYDEEDAPHAPLVINWNRGFAAGSSLHRLEGTVVEQAYGPFLEGFGRQHRALSQDLKSVNIPRRRSDADNCAEVRSALSSLPEGTSHGSAPEPAHLFLPPSHRKALAPDVLLVTGIRGSGKTFWWSALQESKILAHLGRLHLRLAPTAKSEILAGFGVTSAPSKYPDPDELTAMIADHVNPQLIWRTVHAYHLADVKHQLRRVDSWSWRLQYAKKNSDEITNLFRDCDERLDRQGKYSLTLFDALDRSADDWSTVLQLIRGLLQHALNMRSFRRLRAKVFLRSDQAREANIADFADASKVFASEVELAWPRSALYGMLWQYLGNGAKGDKLRSRLAGGDWRLVNESGNKLYMAPLSLTSNEDFQREIFHSVVTGPWMGSGPKRGAPYTWIPNHLGDAYGKVSPRSFIEALRNAAEDTSNRFDDHNHALHYKSIKNGVRRASQIRVREVGEDYPWVAQLLEPLAGIVVPCNFERIEEIWSDKKILKQLSSQIDKDEVKLPPRNIERGEAGVREDLESVGVFRRLIDGRVNIPDVFRIGYGLGRRGGVKPVK